MTKSPDLSIVILNYNSGQYLKNCLVSIYQSDIKNDQIEIIVVDNASSDNSLKLAQNTPPIIKTKYLSLKTNLGFSAGNNRGLKISHPSSRYVLFLNPDTIVNPDTLFGMIQYLDKNPSIHATTCYVKLALTNQLQPECHRGFPTPGNAFWHFFGFGLPKFFPKSKIFNGYFQSYKDFSQPHQIDCCVGAFLMIRKRVGESLGWWNEKYFFYGEDLDFCYQLQKHHYKLFFNPEYQITHFQGISSGLKTTPSAATRQIKIKSALASTNAMRIFYRENLMSSYPRPLHWLIWLGIKLLEIKRIIKAKYL